MSKKEILSRLNLKDYNKELETILEEKDFQGQVKNLLLSMFYRLEIGYKDYLEVKKEVLSKETLMETLIYIIKEKCKKIELIKPKDEENIKKFTVIPEEGKIMCLQNEAAILHALLELGDKYFIIPDVEEVLSKPIQDLLKQGFELDIKELITNFDGWSWNNNLDKNDNLDYYLIYELLTMMMGNSFMYEWKRDRREVSDYLIRVRKESSEMHDAIYKYSIMKTASNEDGKKFIANGLKGIKSELEAMENKTEFLKQYYDKKKELSQKIKEIDTIISNSDLIKEEFLIRNEELPEDNKIFSISDLEEIMQKEREELIEQTDEINQKLDPRNYLRRMQKLQEEIDRITESNYKKSDENVLEKELIEIQKTYIEYLKKKYSLIENKKEIQELLYKFRYYLYLPIKLNNEIVYIKDVQELSQELKKLERKIITKACKLKGLAIINEDINYNAMITEKIIDTRLTNISSITVTFEKTEENIVINIFDGEVQDRTETVKRETDRDKDFRIKFDKKIKIFI